MNKNFFFQVEFTPYIVLLILFFWHISIFHMLVYCISFQGHLIKLALHFRLNHINTRDIYQIHQAFIRYLQEIFYQGSLKSYKRLWRSSYALIYTGITFIKIYRSALGRIIALSKCQLNWSLAYYWPDRGCVSVFVLLELGAAYETTNHTNFL